jgi:hypothetical protein
MIPVLILEVPHRHAPVAYSIRDLDHLREIAHEQFARDGRTVYECTTAGAILKNEHPRAAEYAAKHGAETPLYRADYARSEGEYSPDPISEEDAILKALGSDLHALRAFATLEEARRALEIFDLPVHQLTESVRRLRRVLENADAR